MMNPAELKELAAVLTGIADRKPWQMRSSENVEWGLASDGADPMDVIKVGFQIRLKSWELTDTVNGHTLPPGASWHRQDFTEEMLPPPYRPIMFGEDRVGDDEVFGFLNKGPWRKCSELKSRFHDRALGRQHNLSRTTRPIPFTLTPAQVTEGWLTWNGGECPVEPESMPTVMYGARLTCAGKPASELVWFGVNRIIAYRPDPYGHLRQALADGKTIQWFIANAWHDVSPDWTMAPDKYRIKEPQWVKLGPSDISPRSCIKMPSAVDGTWFSVLKVSCKGVHIDLQGETSLITWDKLKSAGWLVNRQDIPTLWEPCRKPSAV